jgi:hypothetical protein
MLTTQSASQHHGSASVLVSTSLSRAAWGEVPVLSSRCDAQNSDLLIFLRDELTNRGRFLRPYEGNLALDTERLSEENGRR